MDSAFVNKNNQLTAVLKPKDDAGQQSYSIVYLMYCSIKNVENKIYFTEDQQGVLRAYLLM